MSFLNDELTIVVIGYDGYSDVWNHFFHLLNQFWPTRPKTMLITNALMPEYENVTVIPAGQNAEWSRKAQLAIRTVDTEYILLLLEDFFICENVNNDELAELVQIQKTNDVKFLQLARQLQKSRRGMGKRYKEYRHLHEIPINREYRLNLQAAIWEKDYLKMIVGDGNYNAWSFELKTMKSRHNELCLYDDRNLLNITHAVVQSKYLPNAVKRIKAIGESFDPQEREIMDFRTNFKYKAKLIISSITPRPLVKIAKWIGRTLLGYSFVSDTYSET